jgi:hypothetical protein
MKKLLFAFTAVALTFTACKKDETDDIIINENPTVKFTVGEGFVSGNATVENGSAITIGIEATSYGSTKLKTLSVTRTFTGGTVEDVDTQSDINEVFAGYVFTGNAATTAGIEIWTATVVDKDNKTSTATLILTTNDGFNVEVSGAFFHVFGSLKGAYDLVNDVLIAENEDESLKDMKNIDQGAVTFTGGWESGSGNGSLFLKANGLVDYDNVVYSELKNNFTTGLATIVSPQAGDLYIAHLRGQDDYALIKITEVDAANNDCQCTYTGKISFDYKK